jgi:50S ribosomal protein L16 3-hydroxylase
VRASAAFVAARRAVTALSVRRAGLLARRTKRSAPGLRELLHPVAPTRFLHHYWTRRALLARAAHARLPELFDAPELRSLAGLLGCPHRQVQAWFATAGGGHMQLKVSDAQALALYRGGATTVVVDYLEHPQIDHLLQQMHRELGTPQHEVFCSVYVSPPGIGTVMHFDSQDLFFVQIEGKKRWRIAKVAELEYPTRSFVPAVGKLEPDLARVVSSFPKQMPKSSRSLMLDRGSVLYMPKGYWHTSQTVRESIALTLTFPSMSWMDVTLEHLRRRLVQRAAWRAPAIGLLARGKPQLDGLTRLQDLLDALGSEIGSLSVVDLLTS